MTDYIFKNAIGDTYDFEAMIKPATFIMSSIGTFVVVYIVNQFLAKKIKKIQSRVYDKKMKNLQELKLDKWQKILYVRSWKKSNGNRTIYISYR